MACLSIAIHKPVLRRISACYNDPMSSSFVYAFLAGVFPSFIWLWFWLREDAGHPEPRWLLTFTFLGGFVAVIGAIFAEQYISRIFTDSVMRYTLWAAIEEIFKFLAVMVIALSSDYNDEPIDAMIYCIVVALGFSALENAFFLLQPVSSGAIATSIVSENMRFVGATIVHVVSSATIGFALGLVFYRGAFAKFSAVVIGLAVAIALHTGFNLSIIQDISWSDTLQTFAWFWGAVVILIILFEEIKAVRPRLL
jgi:RsiW-degrading membrane proteinase PrsW (M82 family)